LTSDHTYRGDRLYVGRFDLHIQPAWTPDGKIILFLCNRDVPLGSGNLWVMPAVENGIADARQILNEQSLYRARPDVSIDGRRFIYASTGGSADQFNHLYVLPIEGGAPYKMTFGDHDDFHPRWSPDGEHIAYISNEGGLPALIVMDTYGGKKRRIEVRPKVWKTPMTAVSLEVVDETGRPVPARVQGTAADGKFYAPLDAYSRMGVQGQHFFHTPGRSTRHQMIRILARAGGSCRREAAGILEARGQAVCRSEIARLAQRVHACAYELWRELSKYTRQPDVHVSE
jgi:TolB protein